jgi:hypothetical protein
VIELCIHNKSLFTLFLCLHHVVWEVINCTYRKSFYIIAKSWHLTEDAKPYLRENLFFLFVNIHIDNTYMKLPFYTVPKSYVRLVGILGWFFSSDACQLPAVHEWMRYCNEDEILQCAWKYVIPIKRKREKIIN